MKYVISTAIMLMLIIGSSHALDQQGNYAIKAGKILTMAPEGEETDRTRVIDHGVILISEKKIEALGPASEISVPEGYSLIDASDRWVMPGIVEAHTHAGTEGGFNDMLMPVNPELRIADCVNPEDIAIRKAVTEGVTTINTMQGSGTNLGGFTVIIKLDCNSSEDMILRELGMMKVTQAYNPERRGGDLGLTRMGMSWILRQMLGKGKAYNDAWEAYERDESEEKPEYKPELEKMRKVFRGEIPTIVHTYEGWGVMQTIRMFNDEKNLRVVTTHTAGGGYMVGPEAAKRDGVSVNIGPRVMDFGWGAEYDKRFHGMGAEYHKAGVRNLSINTDSIGWSSWIAPQQELSFQASMSARLGLDEMAAMKAITINSARALAIDDRVGSLEVGKDADIVIKKGSLLDVTTPVDLVLINGKIVYQREGIDLLSQEWSSTEMNDEAEWIVRPYFAGELFHFIWSIGEGQYCSRAYPQIKSRWRDRLGEVIAGEMDRLVDWETASMSQSMLGTLFYYSQAESIRDLIACIEDPESLKQNIEKAGISEGDKRGLMSWLSYNIEKNKERLLEVLSALEQAGYDGYWSEEIKPVVEERCREMQSQLSQYSPGEIVRNIQELLGPAYTISSEPKPIYLTYFSYALAYHLPDDSSVHSFKADVPIKIEGVVSTFTHELLHNFTESEKLRAYYDELSDNPLFSKTREILSGYWGEPPTEDLIIAAGNYLVTKMGIASSEQAFHHLYTNYGGAAMLAAIIYDYMEGEGLKGKNYEDFLIDLFQSGKIQAQTLDQQYRAVLERRVGIEEMNSTMEKIERNYSGLQRRREGTQTAAQE